MTEQQPYAVMRRYAGFEVRQYPAHVLAQVDVSGRRAAAASAGFRPLIEYISGRNAARRPIAMTAPVLQQSPRTGQNTVSFVMPAGLEAGEVPDPQDGRVRIASVPPRLVAARRFRGGASDERFDDEERRLLDAIRAAGLEVRGTVSIARFDPPWKPGFLRHNEVTIEVAPHESLTGAAPRVAPTEE